MFDVSPDTYRTESLFELRHLAAGVESIGSAVIGLREVADRSGGQLADALESVTGSQASMRQLLADGLRIQQGIVDRLGAPAATEAAELARRGVSAMRRQLWHRAVSDFDQSLERNWDQPDTLFHRGLALACLGAAQPAGLSAEQLGASAASFRESAECGAPTMPEVAAGAVLLAAAQLRRMSDAHADGQTTGATGQADAAMAAEADALLRWGVRYLPRSPEVLFSAALRFADGELLDCAVRLDPTLALDYSWPDLPFAAAAVAGLLGRQRTALAAANEWLAAAAPLCCTPLPAPPWPQTCIAGLRGAREMIACLEAARAPLQQPTDQEQRLLAEAAGLDDRARAAEMAARRALNPPGQWAASIGLGVGLILLTGLGSMIALYVLVGPTPPIRGVDRTAEITQAVITGACLLLVVAGTLVIMSPLLRASGRAKRAKAITAGNAELGQRAAQARAAAQTIVDQRTALAGRLPAVVAALTAVSTRSPQAYPRAWSIAEQVPAPLPR